jgi:hypothetical protein
MPTEGLMLDLLLVVSTDRAAELLVPLAAAARRWCRWRLPPDAGARRWDASSPTTA